MGGRGGRKEEGKGGTEGGREEHRKGGSGRRGGSEMIHSLHMNFLFISFGGIVVSKD